VQLKDANGNNLTSGGDPVALSTDLGSLGTVTDNGNGTYTATLTAGTTAGTATVTGTLNAVAITDTATVEFTAPAVTGSISGTVTAVGGGPIEGATVSVKGGFSATTDSNGSYTISGLADGTHTVKARAKGFVNASQEITLAVGEDKTGVDFAMTPK
jgi:hypothetical protein